MSDTKVAHLRQYESKNCDIRFMLTVQASSGEILEKEIIGFAKSTGTIIDLKKNIQENIIKLGTDCDDKENNEKMSLVLPVSSDEIKVVFQIQNKPYMETQTLQDYIKSMEQDGTKDFNVLILDQKFSIFMNAPLVRFIRLPSSICANFSVEPAKLNSFNLAKPASKFIWSKSSDKIKWEKVGEGFQYEVKESDVGHYLKLCCVPYSQHKVRGPSAEAISEFVVELISDLPKCPFENRHVFTKQKAKDKRFRVVSYNILADRYVDGIRYPYCPPKALGIHYRKQLIMKELKVVYRSPSGDFDTFLTAIEGILTALGPGYNPDIICLQEVDDIHYREYYREQLHNMGMKSLYNRKGNCIPEGLVCAFNKKRYKLLEPKHLVLKTALERKQFNEILSLLNLNADVKKDFMQQSTSLQATVLLDNKTKNIVIVGNTHLYYNSEADHIRLIQAFVATTFLNNLKNRLLRENDKNNVSVIFCGDFNSPLEKSLYGFMIRGTIRPDHEDCLKISPTGDARIYHQFHLESASGTPKYTNYTEDFKGCLDYIFIDTKKLTVDKNYPVPDETELQKYVGLPNEFYPSDHLALVVDLGFKAR